MKNADSPLQSVQGAENERMRPKMLHFYCYACKAYELQTSPHSSEQPTRPRRKARRKIAAGEKVASRG